jgi:hypothetical protein
VDFDDFLAGRRGRERPGRLVDSDLVGELALSFIISAWSRQYSQGRSTNIYNGGLSLNCNDELLFLDLDVEVSTLEIARYLGCDIQVTDSLIPFVWKNGLLFCLLCASCCFFFGCRICVGRYFWC